MESDKKNDKDVPKKADKMEFFKNLLNFGAGPSTSSEEIPSFMESGKKDDKDILKKADKWLIIAGFVLSVLGGFLGMIIGVMLVCGKYDQESKATGWIILIVGLIMTTIWKQFLPV